MSENGKENGKGQAPKPTGIKALRESHGGMSEEFKRFYQNQLTVLKTLREALRSGGAQTVPELAMTCNLEQPVVMWHLMALRRYGEVHETGQSGDYLQYTLKEAGR